MCISPAVSSHPKKNSKTSTTYLDSPRPNRAPAPRAFLSPTFLSFFLCSVAAAASSSALALLSPPPPSSSMFPLQKTCCRVCLYWQQNTGQVERRRRRCFTSSCPRLSPLGLHREEPSHGDDTVCTKTVVGMVLLGSVYAPLRSRFSSIRTPPVLLLLVRPRLFPMGNDPFLWLLLPHKSAFQLSLSVGQCTLAIDGSRIILGIVW